MTFLTWLAHSPLASFFKVFSAGVLGWVLINFDNLGLHPALALGLAAGLPIIINWLNPNDPRYGKFENETRSE
jgi:hypothetical protein